jgi:hypothetical protein
MGRSRSFLRRGGPTSIRKAGECKLAAIATTLAPRLGTGHGLFSDLQAFDVEHRDRGRQRGQTPSGITAWCRTRRHAQRADFSCIRPA